jgi:hypothetical protein
MTQKSVATQIEDLTASRALVTGASKELTSSAVTSTELGYVSGVTSSIQTQIGNKAAKGTNADITSTTALTSISNAGDITIESTGAGINITTDDDAGDDFAVNTNAFIVEGDTGNVGIGTDPATVLHVKDTNAALRLESSSATDADGLRWSQLDFYGTQSGGEVSRLALIEASHEGTSDDTKGQLQIYTNDGSSAAVRVKIASNGDAWFIGDVSALTFTDRTPYPETTKLAYDAIKSLKKSDNYNPLDKHSQLKHSELHEFLQAPDGESRDMSATVSCLCEVVKDLIKRIDELETKLKQK